MRGSRRAFTLVELLVSIGLVVLLVGAMSAFLSDAMRTRARVVEESSFARSADAMIAAIERALETSIVEDAVAGSGISGGPTSISILKSGASTWRLGTRTPERALEEIDRLVVRFDEASGAVSIGRGDVAPTQIPGTLHRVRFRYFDGTSWRSRFDSVQEGRLPAAVEIAIWHRAPRTEEPPPPVERPEFDDATDIDESGEDAAEEADAEALPSDARRPDRLRVVAIPDAPPAEDVQR
jgi:type II secretory pathway pseudopilin PulG